MDKSISAEAALDLLREGNAEYVRQGRFTGDVSPEIRRNLKEHGQHPFACVITCSDSRVIPESVFSVDLGELFVVRNAGNVVGEYVLGSVEYSVNHLNTPLVVVLGHTECGAVGAALSSSGDAHIASIVSEIRDAVGSEHDYDEAIRLNARHSVEKLQQQVNLTDKMRDKLKIVGALYDIATGEVEFFAD